MSSEGIEESTTGRDLTKLETEEMENLKCVMLKLHQIWSELGLDEDQKEQRSRTLWIHVRSLVEDICEEELFHCEDLKETIRNYNMKIEELSNALQVTPIEVQGFLIEKAEMLRQELDSLTKLKNARLEIFQNLKKVEAKYCRILNLDETDFSHNSGVPTKSDILELQERIAMLKAERERRFDKFCHLKTQLTAIREEIGLEPETLQEIEILNSGESISLGEETFKSLDEMITRSRKLKADSESRKEALLKKVLASWQRLQIDESEKAKFLSNHRDCKVKTLRSIEEELERCEEVKRENMERFIEILKAELEGLLSKACVAESQKPDLVSQFSSEQTEEILEEYEKEVGKWESYFNSVGHILLKIQKHRELFEKMRNLDQKARDPNRFKNRQGNLLKEERMRNKLQKDLPDLETDIFRDIEEYEAENGASFLYFGEDFRTLVNTQWAERNEQKETVKLERQKLKIQLQTDARVCSPLKSPLVTTPKTTPHKHLKAGAGSEFRKPSPVQTPPSTVARLTSKCGSVFPSRKKEPKTVLERNYLARTPQNTSTHIDFSEELDNKKRNKSRSSVLATKKPGGTRIPIVGKTKTNRKSGGGSTPTSKLKPASEK